MYVCCHIHVYMSVIKNINIKNMDYDTYMGIQQFMSVSLQLYLDGNSLIIDTVLDYGIDC